MRFTAIAILALVMLQATNALTPLAVNSKECAIAAHNLLPDLKTVINDIKSKDNANAFLVLATKVVPEIEIIFKGGKQCYIDAAVVIFGEFVGDYVGPNCVTDIENFIKHVWMRNWKGALAALISGASHCTQKDNIMMTLLKVSDDAACVAAAQKLVPDVKTIIADVKAKNYINAMLVISTKIVPEATTIIEGGKQCYIHAAMAVVEQITGSYIGQQCVAEVMKTIQDADSKNFTTMLIDGYTAAKDCLSTKETADYELVEVTDTAACVAAAQNLVPDVKTVIADVKAKNYLNAMSVVATKIVPEATTIIEGGKQCYIDAAMAVVEQVAEGYVGQQCATEVMKTIQDAEATNWTHMLMDGYTAAKDCLSKKEVKFMTLLSVNDDTACVAAALNVERDVKTIIADVKAKNYVNALLVVVTNMLPEAMTFIKGGKQCYIDAAMAIVEQFAGDYVGKQCIADVMITIKDAEAKNYPTMAIDAISAAKDCLSKQ